jgi:hypothetical protein
MQKVRTNQLHHIKTHTSQLLKEFNAHEFVAISRMGVVMHGAFLSPPCCKVMYILDRYGVQYTTISSAKKDSGYKKVPVLLIGDKQINDSEIIATILAKVLDGVEYSKFEQEIEKLTTGELMIACEVFVIDSTPELQRCGHAMGGCIGSVLCCFACCIPGFGLSKGVRAKFPNLRSVSLIAKDYAVRLGDKKYFHGDTCGVIDCSIFGTLSPFQKSKSATFRDFIAVDRLREWHERMTSSNVKKILNHST